MAQPAGTPLEISHSVSGRNLVLVTTDALFECKGCKEPGYGPRYTDNKDRSRSRSQSQSFDLHTCCALAKGTLTHPLLRNRTFEFLTEPPPPVADTICDACGEPAHGFVYHCSDKKEELDLHPCCALLPPDLLDRRDGRVFKLLRRTSRRCGMCGEKYSRRCDFWAYRTYLDGEAVDVHMACMKEMARLSWKAAHENRVGGAQIVLPIEVSVETMLKSMPGTSDDGFDKFVGITGAVMSTAIAVISGNPTGVVTAVTDALRHIR
ncbi:unnamed protein product [Urochloa decumbens]